MQVNKVTLNTPTFQAKIPTKELIAFICKASTTDNKFASSAATVTKLTNGKIQGLILSTDTPTNFLNEKFLLSNIWTN